tara:strand:- start:279 stop:491 length:213 start_codon:yes stop_codon:yes gene_type:complete
MNLKRYVDLLNDMLKLNPELVDAMVVYSSDDEGNDFNIVKFGPSKGFYEDREFNDEYVEVVTVFNAVCIN